MKSRYLMSVIVLLAACGDRAGQGDAADTSKAAAPAAAPATDNVAFNPALGVDLATMSRTPSGAWYRDMTVGTGALADAGKTVGVHYRGQLPDGTQFDATQPPAPPISFRLGAGRVVPGFEEGATGMRVGGRRLIVIPPALGYGAQGNGPVPPNAYMVFTMDMRTVEP